MGVHGTFAAGQIIADGAEQLFLFLPCALITPAWALWRYPDVPLENADAMNDRRNGEWELSRARRMDKQLRTWQGA